MTSIIFVILILLSSEALSVSRYTDSNDVNQKKWRSAENVHTMYKTETYEDANSGTDNLLFFDDIADSETALNNRISLSDYSDIVSRMEDTFDSGNMENKISAPASTQVYFVTGIPDIPYICKCAKENYCSGSKTLKCPVKST